MSPIPVVCRSCNRLFISNNLTGGSATVSFTNVSVGPCPYCGGYGSVPDGIYELAGATVRYLSAVPRPELLRLQQVLSAVDPHTASVEDVAQQIERVAPSASVLGALLQNAATPLATWLTVFLAIIALLVSSHEDHPTEVQINQIIQQIAPELPVTSSPAPTIAEADSPSPMSAAPGPCTAQAPRTSAAVHGAKVGRNQPCPCGSSLKFKRCCGR